VWYLGKMIKFLIKTVFWYSVFSSLGLCTIRTMILIQPSIRTIHDTLSLTNSTHLTADTVVRCTKRSVPHWRFSFRFPYKKLWPPGLTVPPLSHLICTPTNSILYLANSLAAAVTEPALYRLLTFQVPNLMSAFVAWFVAECQSGSEKYCLNVSYWDTLLRWAVVGTSSDPQTAGTPLVGCPQPEDAPCCGDRDTRIAVCVIYTLVLKVPTVYCTVLYVLYCTVLYCSVLYCNVCTVLYCMYCTVLYCTVL